MISGVNNAQFYNIKQIIVRVTIIRDRICIYCAVPLSVLSDNIESKLRDDKEAARR